MDEWRSLCHVPGALHTLHKLLHWSPSSADSWWSQISHFTEGCENYKGKWCYHVHSATSHLPELTTLRQNSLWTTEDNRAMDGWMRTNPDKTATIYDIPGLVKEAFMSAMTPRNIISGFKVTGIFPFNRVFFPDEDYAPSPWSQTGQTQRSHPTVLTCLYHQPMPWVLIAHQQRSHLLLCLNHETESWILTNCT